MTAAYSTHLASPLGHLLLTSNGTHLTGLWMERQKHYAATAAHELVEKDDLPIFQQTRRWLDHYFQGQSPTPTSLPLAPKGSPFRQNVWKILCEIPYGQTITYGGIAKQIAQKTGRPTMAAQAIGGAVGHNPIAIIIPCHRVMGANGRPTGYAGGIDKKIRLLTHEGCNLTGTFNPNPPATP